MVVLQENKSEFPKTHFAFTVGESDIDAAAASLRKQGINVEGVLLIEWMPAKSIYFADPDGHALELCAPIEPR
jgi:lactoylglutathione lyase